MSYPPSSGNPNQAPPPGPSYGSQAPYQSPGFPDQTQPKPASGNGCLWGCLIGGIGGVVLLILVCVGAVWYVTANAKMLAVNFGRSVAVEAIKDSELSEEDQTQVIAEIDRVVDAYKKGEINETDLQNIFKEVGTSPLLPLAVVYGVEKQYLEKSGLTDEEKADARKQLQRLVRGGMEKKIDQAQIETLMAPLQKTGPNGEKEMKETLTDEEIKTFVAGAKQLADEAMIPDEEFKVDIGDEVKRIVDRGLEQRKKK